MVPWACQSSFFCGDSGLTHDDGACRGMVVEVLANTGQVDNDLDTSFLQHST